MRERFDTSMRLMGLRRRTDRPGGAVDRRRFLQLRDDGVKNHSISGAGDQGCSKFDLGLGVRHGLDLQNGVADFFQRLVKDIAGGGDLALIGEDVDAVAASVVWVSIGRRLI
jgi:hypothetical protein